MPSGDAPLLELSDVSKNYQGLRPLRIERLHVRRAEHIAILGFDQPMAETFINLATGATLPDRGTIRVFGRATASIDDGAEWLTVLDRFGIVSERAVLLEAFSVTQNLAMPFTLDVDPPSDDIRAQAARLGSEMGIPEAAWPRPVSELDPPGRLRLRAARALALDPLILMLEHPTASLSPDSTVALAADIRRAAEHRGCAIVTATADRQFAAAVAGRVLTHEAATGRLTEHRSLLDRLFHS